MNEKEKETQETENIIYKKFEQASSEINRLLMEETKKRSVISQEENMVYSLLEKENQQFNDSMNEFFSNHSLVNLNEQLQRAMEINNTDEIMRILRKIEEVTLNK